MRLALVLSLAAAGCQFAPKVDNSSARAIDGGGETDAGDFDRDAAASADAATADAGFVQTLEFRQGGTPGQYMGALDTYLDSDASGTSFGDANELLFDGESDQEGELFALLQFTEIVGNGAGQIPPNALIQSALLRVVVLDASVAPAGSVYAVAVPWNEDTTFDSFGGEAGVNASDLGELVASAPISGVGILDVTSSVQNWADNTRVNNGWIFVPATGNTDGVDLASSDRSPPADRPTLTVAFVAP